MITLFPQIGGLPKWKRRAVMVLAFPIVIVEANINFLISAYYLWNRERYFGQ